MSGFLHQLAARSLGLAPAAQPRAALPYAAPAPETLAAAVESAPAALPSLAPAPTLPAPPRLRGDVKPAHDLAPLHGQPASDAGDDPAASADGRPAPTAPSPHPTVLPQTAALRHGAHESLPPAPPRRDMPVNPPLTVGPASRSAEPTAAPNSHPVGAVSSDRLSDLESLVSRLLSPATHRPAPAPEPPGSPTTGTPPPTGWRPDQTLTVRPQAGREDLAKAAGPAPETTPEVHITIGRLEVNPPSRPAPPPPRPRGPAPLALGDYLARRAGGRS
ncbi:MAG: hypothetical protein HYU74_13000 [Dechloromonas sp.]|nr:hypothetical protein [Dechloromonas sp.]